MERLVFASLFAVFVACGGTEEPPETCDEDTRAEQFFAGLSKVTDSGYTITLVSSDPAPPRRPEDHTWVISVADGGGNPMDGLDLTTTPFMPDHGHGTPKLAISTAVAGSPGTYEVAPVNLWMAGYWEITVDATDTADDDHVVFKFCLD